MNQQSIDDKTTELMRASSRRAGLSEPLREWYRLFPKSFYRIARGAPALNGNVFVLRLMAEDSDCCTYLCDTVLLNVPSAVNLARHLSTVIPDLDIRLARAAVEWMTLSASGTLRRCLLVLDSLKPGARVNSTLVQLLGSNDGAVKSKVFQLLIRSSFNEQNIRTWLRDPDPRIRANLLEALAANRPCPEWICAILREHLSDPNGRTAANAAVALFRTCSESQAMAQLDAMALSEDPARRCSAAWALGQLPDADVTETLRVLRTDADSRVRWNALKSLSRVHKSGPRIPASAPIPEEIAPQESETPEPEEIIVELPPEPQTIAFHTRTFGRLI